MPLFFLHLRDGTDEILDAEGHDLADMAAVRHAVLTSARDVIGGSLAADGIIDLRYQIDAENEHGEIVYSLPFAHSVNIIPPEA